MDSGVFLSLQIEDYQIARKQPPHLPPSFSISYLGIFSGNVHVFRCHLHFNQTFWRGSSSRRNGVSFLRLGRSSAASGPNAQGHSDGSAVDVQDFWGQSRDFSFELASELPS